MAHSVVVDDDRGVLGLHRRWTVSRSTFICFVLSIALTERERLIVEVHRYFRGIDGAIDTHATT